jgi:Lrp/AsnC family transcriptional regulator, leucine-responsive regulatory protein
MLDNTDMQILNYLKKNSRMQWKEIGELVHLTGPAVAARIRRMEDLGVIKAFTVNVNHEKLGKALTAFITVFMKTTDHQSFQRFLIGQEMVTECHRVSGEGCYWLKINCTNHEDLNNFLDQLLRYGNYRLSLSIGEFK